MYRHSQVHKSARHFSKALIHNIVVCTLEQPITFYSNCESVIGTKSNKSQIKKSEKSQIENLVVFILRQRFVTNMIILQLCEQSIYCYMVMKPMDMQD